MTHLHKHNSYCILLLLRPFWKLWTCRTRIVCRRHIAFVLSCILYNIIYNVPIQFAGTHYNNNNYYINNILFLYFCIVTGVKYLGEHFTAPFWWWKLHDPCGGAENNSRLSKNIEKYLTIKHMFYTKFLIPICFIRGLFFFLHFSYTA